MTCIVGVVDKPNHRVVVGGDSAGVEGWSLSIRRDPKVFRIGEFALGFTSSFRMGQLLQIKFEPPKISEGQDLFAYMIDPFVETVRKVLKDGGYTEIHENRESGGTFIVGIRGRLFEVQDDFQVAEPVDDFTSVGCGRDIAKGAMFAAKDIQMSAENRVELSLRAAEHLSAGVRGPFRIITV